MNDELRKQIEILMPQAKKNAAAIAKANKMVHVSGTRYKLELKGRTLDMVYYKSDYEKAPLIVGYHGGGFLYGGCALDDDLWCAVVKALGVNVASIGYRKSPEYKWQVCLDDSYDSVIYLKNHCDEFGFDPESISVMGSSAGGNLAAAVALKSGMTKELRLKNQILVYPFLDVYTEPDCKGEGSFSGPMPYIMNELHCSEEEAKNPLCSPYYADKNLLKELPNIICAVAENDNLRPEAEDYCKRIRNAGGNVSIMLAKDMPHGYIENGFKKRFKDEEFGILGPDGKKLFESGLLKQRSQETLEFIKTHMI